MQTVTQDPARDTLPETTAAPELKGRANRPVHRALMRPRRLFVKVHRWLSFLLLAWLVVVCLTGAWLTIDGPINRWLHGDLYESTEGDVGVAAVMESARAVLPEDAHSHSLTLPVNGRGVYQVYAEIETVTGTNNGEDVVAYSYPTVYVDPGTGEVNGIADDGEGLTWWFYRGHMYLWQDYGLFGMFDPETGWCRQQAVGRPGRTATEPGGVKGVVCDVVPDGMDMVGWFGVGWIVILLTGFYLWYWPGVKRWARAFSVRIDRGAFSFNMSLHKAIGFVVWIPLLVVAFTGITFAFPNLMNWYDNVTPAQRGFSLWVPPEDAISGEANGREPLAPDEALAVMEENYPTRTVNYFEMPDDETGTYWAWVSRGFDPWTREGGAGNTYLAIDQYTGETLYDGTPEEGNVFDQAWDDWIFPLHAGDFLGTIVAGAVGPARAQPARARRHRRRHELHPPEEAVAGVEAASQHGGDRRARIRGRRSARPVAERPLRSRRHRLTAATRW